MLADMAKPTHQPPTDAARDSLLDFILHHLRVRMGLCSLQRVTRGYTLEHRTIPDWNFIYVTQGKAVWVIDGVDHPLNTGDLVMVPPHVEHHAYSTTKKMRLVSVHVEPKLPGGQDVFALLPPPRTLTVERDSPLDRYLRGAETEMDRLSDQPMVCRLYLTPWARLAALEMLRCHGGPSARMPATIDPLLVRILQLLSDRLTESLTLAELSHRVGYSGQHLNRLFRRELGVTPLQHHRRLKLEKAAELLVRGALSVQGVGHAVGIADPFYFSRLFQQHFGKSPTEYRRSAETAMSDSV